MARRDRHAETVTDARSPLRDGGRPARADTDLDRAHARIANGDREISENVGTRARVPIQT
jgi:hypothetical protein